MTAKFTVKTRPCVEYLVTDPSGTEHGPFSTRIQATTYVAKMLGVSMQEVIEQIEYPRWNTSKEGKIT